MTDSSSEVSPLCEMRIATSPGCRHSEIAVDCFSKVEEGRGRSSRRECRRDLAPDMARLAKTADDQFALAIEDQPHRVLERPVEAVGERVQRPRFVVQDFTPELEDVLTPCAGPSRSAARL